MRMLYEPYRWRCSSDSVWILPWHLVDMSAGRAWETKGPMKSRHEGAIRILPEELLGFKNLLSFASHKWRVNRWLAYHRFPMNPIEGAPRSLMDMVHPRFHATADVCERTISVISDEWQQTYRSGVTSRRYRESLLWLGPSIGIHLTSGQAYESSTVDWIHRKAPEDSIVVDAWLSFTLASLPWTKRPFHFHCSLAEIVCERWRSWSTDSQVNSLPFRAYVPYHSLEFLLGQTMGNTRDNL